MSDVNPPDAAWRQGGAARRAGRSGRWALSLALLVLLIGTTLFIVFLHLVPSVGAAGGCGGG